MRAKQGLCKQIRRARESLSEPERARWSQREPESEPERAIEGQREPDSKPERASESQRVAV